MKIIFRRQAALLVFTLCLGALAPSLANAAPAAEWRSKVAALASKSFKHPAWGYSHCLRDYALATALAEKDHVALDDDVLFAAAYLHDADALDWLGAIGVARMLALIDPQGGAPDGAAAVKMIEGYLARTPSRIVSPAGKALASVRIAEERAFLEALRAETESLKAL